jgi:hypothetical protein
MNDVSQDDWGFYVDLENVPQNNNIEYKKPKILEKYYEEICDEYEYNVANYDSNLDCILPDLINKCNEKKENSRDFFIRVSSTTIITAVLTYIVFFVL